jgi:hypothetical protein
LNFVNQLNFIIHLNNGLNYDFSLSEYALYSNHIYLYPSQIALVWAAAVNQGNQEIYTLFSDIVYNRHETAKVSSDIIRAMLLSDKPEAWEAVEKLLLSAQRQEGLRQTILECLDETSLGAMKRLIKIILEHKLTRFSSVVRALDVWAGLAWESQRETVIIRILEFADKFLENPELIPQAMQSKDNAEVYMALWAQGAIDVMQCFPLIDSLLVSENAEKINLALYFLKQADLEEKSIAYGKRCIHHDNLMVFANAIDLLSQEDLVKKLPQNERDALFETLTPRLKEVPTTPKIFEGQVFAWLNFDISKEKVFSLMIALIDFENEMQWDKILPYFEEMQGNQRGQITQHILPHYYSWNYKEEEGKKLPALTIAQRDFAFKILRDRSTDVRTAAMRALSNAQIADTEIVVFEEMLTRKSGDLRKSVIALLLKQSPTQIQKTTERLLKAGNSEQRLAGLDLLTQLKTNKMTDAQWIIQTAQTFAQRPKINDQEKVISDNILATESAVLEYNTENGFGLYNPANHIPYQIPQLPEAGEYVEKTQKNPHGLSNSPEKINKALQQLKALVLANQTYEYSYEGWDGSSITGLLGNVFEPLKRKTKGMSLEEQFYNYPLAEVWKKWLEDSQLTPLELFWINLVNEIEENNEDAEMDDEYDEEEEEEYEEEDEEAAEATTAQKFPITQKRIEGLIFKAQIPKIGEYYWQNPLTKILNSLTLLHPYSAEIDFLSGLYQTICGNIAPEELNKVWEEKSRWSTYHYTWRNIDIITAIYTQYTYRTYQMTDAQFIHFWQLEKWKNDTLPKDYPNQEEGISSLDNYARAYSLQLITQDEMLARVMKTDALQTLTYKASQDEYDEEEDEEEVQQEPYDLKKNYPFLNEMLDACRNRILEIELKRGDSSTPVTRLAQSLQVIYGMDSFFRLLVGLGKENLHRGYIYSWGSQEYNKKEILSTLLKRCQPVPEENQDQFNESVKSFKINEKRLVEAATYSPQWLKYVSTNLGWQNMIAAVWWLHAHTNGHHSAETETEIAKYSKVAITDFKDGAVDTDWFREVYQALGKDRWQMLYDSAKYISDGNGHNRAKLYADVILGNTGMAEVIKRVSEKRNQDYLRVYGLLPLDGKNPDKDLLKRYQYLQKFKKESKQFGSQRQTSEGLAVRIAMDNLARTAGFSDPIRLTWAMETEEAIQIIQKAKSLNFNEVTLSLVVDEDGKSAIECMKGEKKLKSIPDNLKKEEAIIELKEFNTTLQNQYKRTRKSLEEAMVNGDNFKLSEITTLMSHPVVSPMLQKLVLKSGNQLGFWQAGKLVSVNGNSAEPKDTIQIAHCTDLYFDGQWVDYQRYCFEKQIKQPFKQTFRELYIPTEDELKEKTISRRYAGHQVQPKKTVALLKTQGWTVDYDEGLQKVFHKEGFIAKMYAMADWFSPADVESPTLETVQFMDKKTWKTIDFETMDKRVFSEVMRDIDLVVSVAHVGEVDPEASQSSIALRTALVRETLRLFKITNVELKGNHALITGKKGNYSIHLGSAIAHKVPGIYLSILPIHSQHRGQMFLPFLDEDPKTAEIMSKVLLLAKDDEIQDPTVLRQLSGV